MFNVISEYVVANRDEFEKMIKFSIVGVLNTAVFFVLFFILFEQMSLHYLASTTVAYFFATINSFVINKSWTFNSEGNSRTKFIKFVFVNIASVITNSILMFILVDIVTLNPWSAQIFTVAVTMCVNYTGNRLWTFGE